MISSRRITLPIVITFAAVIAVLRDLLNSLDLLSILLIGHSLRPRMILARWLVGGILSELRHVYTVRISIAIVEML